MPVTKMIIRTPNLRKEFDPANAEVRIEMSMGDHVVCVKPFAESKFVVFRSINQEDATKVMDEICDALDAGVESLDLRPFIEARNK